MALEPDPRFPDRPTHPDFERLSEAVIQNDAMADIQSDFEVTLAEHVDPQSLLYMARNRVNAIGLIGHADFYAAAMSAWFDGFTAGIVFQQKGGKREGQ